MGVIWGSPLARRTHLVLSRLSQDSMKVWMVVGYPEE